MVERGDSRVASPKQSWTEEKPITVKQMFTRSLGFREKIAKTQKAKVPKPNLSREKAGPSTKGTYTSYILSDPKWLNYKQTKTHNEVSWHSNPNAQLNFFGTEGGRNTCLAIRFVNKINIEFTNHCFFIQSYILSSKLNC